MGIGDAAVVQDYKFVLNPITGELDRVVNNIDVLRSEFTDGSVLFSESGVVVEDNASLFWDNINNRLGLNTTTPVCDLDVNGGLAMAIVAKIGAYTTTVSDHTITCGSGNETFTVTLLAAASAVGQILNIKNVGTGIITVDANGSETIDKGLTAVISTQFPSITIQSDGTEWWII